MSTTGAAAIHRHGLRVHRHPNDGPHHHEHDHAHGLVDPSIVRSREGVKAGAESLAVLGATTGAQVAVFALSGSVALLADLIHNAGDALTAVPLAAAFLLRSARGERLAARIRLRAGKRLSSPALVADGNHARVDGFVSLGVVASAALVAAGAAIGDPIVGLAITLVILRIVWSSWRTVGAERSDPGPEREHR